MLKNVLSSYHIMSQHTQVSVSLLDDFYAMTEKLTEILHGEKLIVTITRYCPNIYAINKFTVKHII